jgi:hypothetical protein
VDLFPRGILGRSLDGAAMGTSPDPQPPAVMREMKSWGGRKRAEGGCAVGFR